MSPRTLAELDQLKCRMLNTLLEGGPEWFDDCEVVLKGMLAQGGWLADVARLAKLGQASVLFDSEDDEEFWD